MSYPISKNINPYAQQQQAMGANTINVPQLQDVNADTIAQSIDQNSVLRGVGGGEEEKNKWLTPLLTVPIGIAMQYGMEKFNAACGDKNILKVIGDWGEKTGTTIETKAPFVKKFFDGAENLKNKFMTEFVPQSKTLSAIFRTPAQPEKAMVLTMYNGTRSEISQGAAQLLEQHHKAGNDLHLNELGISEERFKHIVANSHEPKSIEDIIRICEKQGTNGIKNEGKTAISRLMEKNKFLSELFNRKIYFSEYANKLKAFNNGNKSYLGKKLPRAVVRTLEGITNATSMGTGIMGKLGIIMAAFFVADAAKKTIDAPKGDKVATFAENNIYNLGWYLTMPLGLALMYKPAGLKYLGFSKEQVDAYRARLKQFNDSAKSGQIKDKTVYKSERQKLKVDLKEIFSKAGSSIEIQKTDTAAVKTGKFFANLVRKPLKWAAKILTFGMEQPESFNPKGICKESNFGQKAEQFFKNGKAKGVKGFAGAAMRFGLFMFALAPFLGKFFAKGSHVIFGKPAKSVLDDGEEPKKNQELTIPQQNTVPQPQRSQVIQPQPQVQPAQQVSQPVPSVMQPVNQNQSLAYNQPQMMEEPKINQPEMYTNSVADREKLLTQEGTRRTYIPSHEAVKIDANSYDSQEENKFNAATDKFDKAASNVEKFLR